MAGEVEIPVCLDHEECKKMSDLVEQLTTSGQASLNQDVLKHFKKICRKSDDYVTHAYHLLIAQLAEDHAEIRLSTFQVIDEIFNRSHAFRELLVSEFQAFLELTVGINSDLPLPPPEAVARNLMTKTLESIQQWQSKYGEAYKKLTLGFNFLKNCKKIDFNNIEARTVAQQRRVNEQEERRRIVLNEKLDKARKELSDIKEAIEQSLVEVENCFKLLLPHLEEFMSDKKGSNSSDSGEGSSNADKTGISESEMVTSTLEDTESSDSLCKNSTTSSVIDNSSNFDSCKSSGQPNQTDSFVSETGSVDEVSEEGLQGQEAHEGGTADVIRESGLGSRSYNININLNSSGITLDEDEDNTDILTNLRDQNRLISSKYLPTVIRCLTVMSKAGAPEDEIKGTIDVKRHLESAKLKFSDLDVKKALGIESYCHITGPADSDEDDLEEVPEKEGLEPVIAPHLRKEYGLEPLPTASTSSLSKTTPRDWDIKNLTRSKDDIKDPTTFAANIARMHQNVAMEAVGRLVNPGLKGGIKADNLDYTKDKLMKKAPVLPFGFDLESWENPNPEGPLVLKNMSLHRWWTPIDNDERLSTGNLAALKSRTVSFTGQFVPVKWKCRAPLPNGKLCERMDRVKCPFHGKIIARDELGIPADLQDDINLACLAQQEQAAKAKVQPCGSVDRELQRDIEAATGLDLGSGKGKGKGKGKWKGKRPNLTNVKAQQDTVRKRLEKKVFNKAALKRVGTALDNFDHKRHRDKFANQFHYSLPS